MLVLWCPDWPVVAAAAVAGVPVAAPAAAFHANRVVACSPAARERGVVRGMRRREAQARCPDLAVLTHDPDRDARVFENVATAVEKRAPGVEVVRAGLVALPIAGAATYHGGEPELAELLIDHVAADAGVEAQVGAADSLFGAILAARTRGGTIVAPGSTASFLATQSLDELDQPGSGRADLVDLLRRLGMTRLGDFAKLPESAVAGRFGRDGVMAHRLARGLSERPPVRRRPPPELVVQQEFDPPMDRVDVVAFASKTLGTRLHTLLGGHGLACTQLAIQATTETGESLTRVWRTTELLTAQGISDRLRWQVEGWLQRRDEQDRPSSGIATLRLAPEEIVGGGSLQQALPTAGGRPDAADRAGRALVRVQGILGPDGVVTAVLGGGRGPAERVQYVPWGDPYDPHDDRPWPGRLPAPSPATVPERPWPVEVHDADGVPVGLTGRVQLTHPPRTVTLEGRAASEIESWAGPWPSVLKGQDAGHSGRVVRIQVVLEDERGEGDVALLLCGQATGDALQWTVEGLYD
ncbi:DNA polymerase Y family protein [Amycolatopsis sp. NPDC058986]|uniref:DNA polymerase Y family protein n=1 Tax=unclassified Amycolatopsis TaxID=2618356 RepID=UPI003670FDF4